MPLTIDLSGRVALVTGGGKGVGRGITEAFVEAGAHVAVVSRTQPEQLPDNTSWVGADVRDADACKAAVEEVVRRHDRVDIVVNNAGGAPPSEAATASPRFAEKIVALNLLAPFYVAQAANMTMQQQDDGGVIVNIGSVSSTRPAPTAAVYAAAKAGLANLTKTLAVEWAPKVRVNLVMAGMVRTEQSDLYYGDEAGVAAVAETVPLGRLADPADVGAACVFLASPAAAYVSGAELLLHGGGEWPAFLRVTTGDTGR